MKKHSIKWEKWVQGNFIYTEEFARMLYNNLLWLIEVACVFISIDKIIFLVTNYFFLSSYDFFLSFRKGNRKDNSSNQIRNMEWKGSIYKSISHEK